MNSVGSEPTLKTTLSGLMLAAPRLPSPAHLLNPRRDAPGRVTAFRLAFVGADNYLRGVVA